MAFEIRRYRNAGGGEPFTEWLADLRDRSARARILARLERLEAGNFGDVKALRDGVSEMRIDWGPDTGSISAAMDRQWWFCFAAATSAGRTRISGGRWTYGKNT